MGAVCDEKKQHGHDKGTWSLDSNLSSVAHKESF